MGLVAALDFGGGAVKACVADIGSGDVLAVTQRSTETVHPAPGRAEFEPRDWWRAAGLAMREAVALASRPSVDYQAVSATSLRQGYVLLDASSELGRGVLNSDRRGAGQLDRLREAVGIAQLYEVTGHWPAAQLTLPKLLEEQRASPERWARTRTVSFVHDWAMWRLCGERVSEPSVASGGQLLDVRARTWAAGLLASLGLSSDVLPPLVSAGTVVGSLRDDTLGLPLGIQVVTGGADTQVVAAGAGGLREAAVSVVAGTSTPVQASSATLPRDPERHPWVSAHLAADRWAVETNVGYPGLSLDWLAQLTARGVAELVGEAATSQPGAAGLTALVASRSWSEETWNARAPTALLGFEPWHARADVARAFIEAHAYGIRGNVEDLERAVGARFSAITLLGGAGRERAFAQLVADVLGRPVRQTDSPYPAGRAFAWLAQRGWEGAEVAASATLPPPAFRGVIVEPQPDPDHADAYEEGYARYCQMDEAVTRHLAGLAA